MPATSTVRKLMIAMKNLRMSMPSSCGGFGRSAAMLFRSLVFGVFGPGRGPDRPRRLVGLLRDHAELDDRLARLRIRGDALLLDAHEAVLRLAADRVLQVD